MTSAHNVVMNKVFTVEQANNMLPLVRRIVQDMVRDYARWQDRVREFEVVSLRSTIAQPDPTAVEIERDVQHLAENIDGYVEEIRELGIETKGLESGTIDFPSELDGKPVLLCWKLGEESVQYWHDIASGFAGRQPLEAGMLLT